MAILPPLSVVIPVYNRAHILGRTLQSIAEQSFRPLRVILVDNNSTDSSMSVLQAWKEKEQASDFDISILSCATPGATAARNVGLASVATPFVMFFDSDDIMLPNHVADIAAAIAKDESVDVWGRPIEMNLIDGRKKTGKFCVSSPLMNHIFHASLSTQRYAARTSLLRRVGEWNPNLRCWNDWELGIRLLMANPKIRLVSPVPAVRTFAQEESITGINFISKRGAWEQAIDAAEKAAREAARFDVLKWLNVKRMILAAAYTRDGAPQAARELIDSTLKDAPHKRRLKFLYAQNSIFPRGTAQLANLLLHFS